MPNLRVNIIGSKFANFVAKPATEFLVVHFSASHTNHRKVFRQEFALLEIVKSGNQLSSGEVSGRAKDKHDAWRRSVRCRFAGRCHLLSLSVFLRALRVSVVKFVLKEL